MTLTGPVSDLCRVRSPVETQKLAIVSARNEVRFINGAIVKVCPGNLRASVRKGHLYTLPHEEATVAPESNEILTVIEESKILHRLRKAVELPFHLMPVVGLGSGVLAQIIELRSDSAPRDEACSKVRERMVALPFHQRAVNEKETRQWAGH